MDATESRPQANPDAQLRLDQLCALASKKGAHNMRDRARLIGVHRATLDRWTKGAVPTLGTALQVARRLDAKVEDLWQGVSS